MSNDLQGKHILVISTNKNVDGRELFVPIDELRARGADVVHAAQTLDPVLPETDHPSPRPSGQPDVTLKDVTADVFDALLIPGGTKNVDHLRVDEDAVRLVREFVAQRKLVATICHGGWLLAEADVARNKNLTTVRYIRTDLVNAGARWHDEPVRLCRTGGWPLLTSRTPADLPQYIGTIDEVLAA